jgi:hypothetical protein
MAEAAMNEHGYRGSLVAWLLIGLVLACLLGTSAAASLRPRRITTHVEAVGYVLEQHGVAYEEIRVARNWSGLLQRDAFAADIVVRLSNRDEARGWIECQVRNRVCSLYMSKLGLMHKALPELARRHPRTWLDWIEDILSRLTLPGRAAAPAGSPSTP